MALYTLLPISYCWRAPGISASTSSSAISRAARKWIAELLTSLAAFALDRRHLAGRPALLRQRLLHRRFDDQYAMADLAFEIRAGGRVHRFSGCRHRCWRLLGLHPTGGRSRQPCRWPCLSIMTSSRRRWRWRAKSADIRQLHPLAAVSFMSSVQYGLVGMAALALIIVPACAFSSPPGSSASVGLWALRGFDKAVGIAGHIPYSDTTNYALSVLPLFILIGHLAHHAGIVQGAYRCARAWLGWMPGGLGVATIFAAAGFAAVSGASTATAAVFSRIAIPELLRFKYQPGIAAAVVAAGGTLASLDPAVGDHGGLRHHHRDLDRRPAAGRVHPGRHLARSSTPRSSWSASRSTRRSASRSSASLARALVDAARCAADRLRDRRGHRRHVHRLGNADRSRRAGRLHHLRAWRCSSARCPDAACSTSLLDTVKLAVMIFSIIWGVLIFVRFLAFAGISAAFSDWIVASASRPTWCCCS